MGQAFVLSPAPQRAMLTEHHSAFRGCCQPRVRQPEEVSRQLRAVVDHLLTVDKRTSFASPYARPILRHTLQQLFTPRRVRPRPDPSRTPGMKGTHVSRLRPAKVIGLAKTSDMTPRHRLTKQRFAFPAASPTPSSVVWGAWDQNSFLKPLCRPEQ